MRKMNEAEKRSLLSMIGICKKAGAAVSGTDMICEALRRGAEAPAVVIISEDASKNTEKRLTDKCKFYGTEAIKVPVSSSELGDALGKSGTVAAVGITDAGLAEAVKKKINL